MSYTMTIEAPEKAAWFERRRAKFTPEKLGDLFVTFLREDTLAFQKNMSKGGSYGRGQ